MRLSDRVQVSRLMRKGGGFGFRGYFADLARSGLGHGLRPGCRIDSGSGGSVQLCGRTVQWSSSGVYSKIFGLGRWSCGRWLDFVFGTWGYG